MFPRLLYGFHDLHARVQEQRHHHTGSLNMLDDQIPESLANEVARIRNTQDEVEDMIEEYTQNSMRLYKRLLNVMHHHGMKEQLRPAAVSSSGRVALCSSM